MEIPIVDFSATQLANNRSELAKQILKAFTSIGFVYLKNHGIPQDKIDGVWSVADRFFTLPVDIKMKYCRPEKGEGNDGWIGLERENLNPERPTADYKEAFNVDVAISQPEKYQLVEEVPEFKPAVTEIFHACSQLANIILDVMGLGLGLEDPELLKKFHSTPGSNNNYSTLRILYYPMIGPDVQIKPGQVRCGEHSDYGSITLLWQESKGLQVQTLNGEYIDVPPLPGTVLVNIGHLMQRWTSDKLVAAKHRVLINDEDIKEPKVRKAFAFFLHPDNDALVQCLDGSNKYPPITAHEYVIQRFNATY